MSLLFTAARRRGRWPPVYHPGAAHQTSSVCGRDVPAAVSGHHGIVYLPHDPLVLSAFNAGHADRSALGLYDPRPLLGMGLDGNIFARNLGDLCDLSLTA